MGGETLEWYKFSLLCLIIATGNAISERVFRHGRGARQVQVMLVECNGLSYEGFCAKLNRDSVKQGREWWGYVDRRGERFNNGQEAEQGSGRGVVTVT
jgi:hypothetical protein